MSSFKQLDVESLIEELTLQEKISLLAGVNNWQTFPIERLNIPSVTVSDGPNGVRGTNFFQAVPSNCFPCGSGMASTFNKDLLKEAGVLMGKEAKMKLAHCILGPTTCISRSPLGGRDFESYSEDPVLSGIASSAVINGIQQENVVACIKHFVCNDQEDERKSVDTLVSERALREIYLKPFQMAVKNANPKALMTSYNKVNGLHVSQSKKLLQDVLRKEWGYDGTVMSDWYGVYSSKEALDAGLNLEMPGPTRFRQPLQMIHQVTSNEIHRDVIDTNVRYVLKFVNECMKANIPEGAKEEANESPEASELLRKIADESIVLLKNENNILPLSPVAAKGNEKIAVIGPNVKVAQDSGGGSASMRARYKITPWQGIVDRVSQAGKEAVTLEYALGAHLDKSLPDLGGILQTEDGKTGVTARFYLEGPEIKDREPFAYDTLDTTRIFLSDYTHPKLKRGEILFYAEFEGYFIPETTDIYEFGCSCLGSALLYVDDQLVVDNKTKQVKGDAFFLAAGTREERGEIKLEKGKKYKVKVVFGTYPTGQIESEYSEPGGVNFGAQVKRGPEQALNEAVSLAKSVDKVVLVVGISKDWESEGFDRPDMDIPGHTNQLVEAIAKVNPNVVVVNQSGSPVTLPWINKVQAFVQAWYGGNETGNAIADVLFGDYNPSGKLSLTFPEKNEHNPAFLNFGATNGRVWYGEDVFVGYRFYEKTLREPLFAFGYGLSYTTFKLSNLTVDANDEVINVKVDVENTGKVSGAETVQVYIAPVNPLIIRPNKELKDFGKVFLKPGESKSVEVSVPVKEATSYWNSYKNKWHSEKGTYKVLVGNSSDNITLEAAFETSKTTFWLGL